LIPRPETEALVDWIIHSSWKKSPTILDIGTGSGCIAVSLAKNIPQANVYALDISAGALKTAANNASTNQVKVHFLERDLLSCNDLPKRFDIIVSNPPYVRQLEKKQMQQNVLAYEPASALYVPDKNPLLFYRKISELATKHLDKEGSLFLEINQYLGKETCELLTSVGFANIELKKDLYKADRMVKAQFK
ncbi:MAG: HemK/PrmC family methyltransferase, partial [Lutibacter sp.]|nr:HemK/PrmC family methyltransferase [Lutibacter sp.]